MIRRVVLRPNLGSVCLLFWTLAAAAQPLALPNRFDNRPYRFSVSYPSGWWPEILSHVFYIESFPPSRAVRAARIPPGQAGIQVVTASQAGTRHRAAPDSIDEWAARLQVGNKLESRGPFSVADDHRTLTGLEVVSISEEDPPREQIEWFFTLRGRIFMATVFYWKGDSRAAEWRDTLRQVALSIKSTSK